MINIFFAVLLFIWLSLMGMEDHRGCVNFQSACGGVPVEKRKIPLMYTLQVNYQKYQKIPQYNKPIPLFNNISNLELWAVSNALNIAADDFAQYYKFLSPEDKSMLIKASGKYDCDGKKLMLFCPQLIAQLAACFPEDIKKLIGGYCNTYEKRDYIINFFTKKLVLGKSLLTVKKTVHDLLTKDVSPASFFVNGYCTTYLYDPIPLDIKRDIDDNKKCQTYATRFITAKHEARITDINDRQCFLWLIDHDNPLHTYSEKIVLNDSIKGCFFSKIGAGVEYAVVYSELDIAVVKIMQAKSGLVVEVQPNIGVNVIVDVCFDHSQTALLVCCYQGLFSVLYKHNLNNSVVTKLYDFSFKQDGLFEKMFVYHCGKTDRIMFIFCAAGHYFICCFNYDGNSINNRQSGEMLTIEKSNNKCSDGFSRFLFIKGHPPFQQAIDKTEKNSELCLSGNSYYIYSPGGKYLLHSFIKKKEKSFYVEMVVKDAINHRLIVSYDMPFKLFAGAGFNLCGTELVISSRKGYATVIPLLNKDDYCMMQELKEKISDDFGIISVLYNALITYTQHKKISLYEDDPVFGMFKCWRHKSICLHKLFDACAV